MLSEEKKLVSPYSLIPLLREVSSNHALGLCPFFRVPSAGSYFAWTVCGGINSYDSLSKRASQVAQW